MTQPIPDKRLVYLHCSSIFNGNNAQLRRQKKVVQCLSQRKESIKVLTNEFSINAIATVAKELLEDDIFASTSRARLQFPELFQTSAAQEAEREASEAEAARTEAEAVHEVVPCSDNEWDGDAMDDEPNGRVVVMTHQIETPEQDDPKHIISPSVARTYSGLAKAPIPRLQPVYLPFKTQHRILSTIQLVLEDCCLEFGKTWFPELMKRQKWEEHGSVELTKWTKLFSKHSKDMPSTAIEQGHGKNLKEVFFATSNIRHCAVHRLQTNTTSIKNLVNAAVLFTETLKDAERPALLRKIQEQLTDSIDEVMRHQNLLERKLCDEMDALAKKRAELDELERLAVQEMVTDDEINRKLAGLSMDGFLSELWHGLDYCTGNQRGLYQVDVPKSEDGVDPSDSVKLHDESQHEEKATPVQDRYPEGILFSKDYLPVEEATLAKGYLPAEYGVPAEDCSPLEDFVPAEDTLATPNSSLFAFASTSDPTAAPSTAYHLFPVTSTPDTRPTPPSSTCTVGLSIIHGPILLTEIVSLSSPTRSCILAKAQATYLKHYAEQERIEEAAAVQNVLEYILRSVQIDGVNFSVSTYDHDDLTFLVRQISHAELPRFTVEVMRMLL